MKNRLALKTLSILSFSAAFLLASVAVPFLNGAGANTQIDFIKKAKQEGIGSFTKDLTITDASKPVIFRIYVYNPTDTTYTSGRLWDEFPFDQTGNVKNRALIDTDQTPYLYSDVNIDLPDGKKLIYRPGSTRVYGYNDSVGSPIQDVNGLSPLVTPQGLRINDIKGAENKYKEWYVFYADIVDEDVPTPKPAPSMETTKVVRNITTNSGFANSVSASKGDVLEYRIWVHNKVVGSEANDVIVKDALPIAEGEKFVNKAFISGSNFATISDTATVSTPYLARLEYIPGTTRTFVHADKSEGVLVPDVNGRSKLFSSGVSLGDVKGCFELERFVTFKVKVIKPEVLKEPPVVITTLPDTGPGAVAILLFGSVPAGLAIRAIRRRI
jgi:hypothetical protein